MQTTGMDVAHLSQQQQRLWAYQSEQAFPCHTQGAVLLKGELREDVLQRALQITIEQHEILHTVFRPLPAMEMPVQVVEYAQAIFYPVVSLEGIAPSTHAALLRGCAALFASESYDLACGPLVHLIVFRLSARVHILLLSFHALCADSTTLPLFITHLNRCYMLESGKDQFSEEPLQYVDVCRWQQKLLGSEGAQIPGEFWRNLHPASTSSQPLPFEQGASNQDQVTVRTTYKPQMLDIEISEALYARAREFTQRSEVSLEEFLLTCWSLLLGHLTEQIAPVVGIACNGRVHEELADALGPYTRFISLPVRIEPSWSFNQALNGVASLLRQAQQWQLYCPWSGEQANDTLRILFEYIRWPAALAGSPWEIAPCNMQSYTEPFALKLSICQTEAQMHMALAYDINRLPALGMQRLLSSWLWLLEQVLEQPQALVRSFSLLRTSEQRALQVFLNGSSLPVGQQSLLHQLFEAQARRWPERIALISRQEVLSYAEANRRANQLARWLRRQGVGPNVLVGVCMPRSAGALVAVLAILKAGGAYAPMDGEMPPARLVELAQREHMAMILIQSSLKARLAEWPGRVECMEALLPQVSNEADTDLAVCGEAADLAYLISTSGSTGTPKGVMIQHRSAVNYSLGLCAALELKSGWSFATVSSLAADLGNTAIFGAWATGGSVQVLDYETVTSRETFARWVEEHPIDVLKIVPSHLAALLGEEEERGDEILPRQILLLGGERFPGQLVERLGNLASGCRVYNHYGPTETTIGVLMHEVKDGKLARGTGRNASVPLGKPFACSEVYVLNKRQHMVPVGVRGELYIGGEGLAVGYYQQSEQTAERFVPDGFTGKQGRRLYRTGDLVKVNESGEIEFEGREDGQVKLRGHRVELGEIEAVLTQHSNIRMSAVVLREGERLAGYIVARRQPEPAGQELREYARALLPEYMVPSIFVSCKSLPLTASGKLDRRKLASTEPGKLGRLLPVSARENTQQSLIQPRDMIEFRLLRIWEKILPIQSISVTDNFFDLGGHSILAVRLMAHIFQEFQQNLPLTTLFQHPTLADLAGVLRQRAGAGNQEIVIPLQPSGSRLPFFCVHPFGRSAFDYTDLARHLGEAQPFYGFQSPDLVQTDASPATVEALAASYVAAIQTMQHRGPYLIGGWSAGGVVALEMAQQLSRSGHEVALLAILDSQLADEKIRARAAELSAEVGDEELVAKALDELQIAIPDDFYTRSIEAQFEYVISKLKQMNKIPADMDVDMQQARQFVSMTNRQYIANRLYIPQEYHGQIDYFLSDAIDFPKDQNIPGDIPARYHYLRNWYQIAKGGITVHPLLSDHRGMLQEPSVQELASLLKRCIESIR